MKTAMLGNSLPLKVTRSSLGTKNFVARSASSRETSLQEPCQVSATQPCGSNDARCAQLSKSGNTKTLSPKRDRRRVFSAGPRASARGPIAETGGSIVWIARLPLVCRGCRDFEKGGRHGHEHDGRGAVARSKIGSLDKAERSRGAQGLHSRLSGAGEGGEHGLPRHRQAHHRSGESDLQGQGHAFR